MKQTAIELAFEQLDEQVFRIDHVERRINISISFEDMMTLKKEAKEIENEQIQDAFDIGFCEGFDFGYRDFDPTYESGEMYYDKTYGKK
jgi:hypothetical protein